MPTAPHISVGTLGETIATKYLYTHGYQIIARNYRKKCGELDIIAKKEGVLHFVEVKSGTWKRSTWPKEGEDVHRPEMHMNARKHLHMRRAIMAYLHAHKIPQDTPWTADLAVVLIHEESKRALIRWIWNILL
jgi:putative endonuclease